MVPLITALRDTHHRGGRTRSIPASFLLSSFSMHMATPSRNIPPSSRRHHSLPFRDSRVETCQQRRLMPVAFKTRNCSSCTESQQIHRVALRLPNRATVRIEVRPIRKPPNTHKIHATDMASKLTFHNRTKITHEPPEQDQPHSPPALNAKTTQPIVLSGLEPLQRAPNDPNKRLLVVQAEPVHVPLRRYRRNGRRTTVPRSLLPLR